MALFNRIYYLQIYHFKRLTYQINPSRTYELYIRENMIDAWRLISSLDVSKRPRLGILYKNPRTGSSDPLLFLIEENLSAKNRAYLGISNI